MQEEKSVKKPSMMGRIKKMEVGDVIRLDILCRPGIKANVSAYSCESKKKFAIKTAKNKNSFTVTRLM